MIDTKKLKTDLLALASDSRALKRVLHATWTRPMADEQKRLRRVQRRTTELLILLAQTRRKLHLRHVPAGWGSDAPSGESLEAWHARIAARVAKDYAKSDAPIASDNEAPIVLSSRQVP